MTTAAARVGDLDEDALIARIQARLPAPSPDEAWTGDDTAILKGFSGEVLFTADALVEGVDFQLAWSSPEDVGWKALAANASDIAAMGGRPSHAVVALCLHPSTELGVIDELVDGMVAAGTRWGIGLAGGDLSRGRELVVSVAMIGSPSVGGPIRRSTARSGDVVCVTGSLGGAAGGLLALRRGLGRASPRSGPVWRLIERQVRPLARVDEGRALAASNISSMIDLSDGLAADLARLTSASGVGCRIRSGDVPVDASLLSATDRGELGPIDPLETAIVGGEDFELLFTVAEPRLEAARAALEGIGASCAPIGEITEKGRTIDDNDLEMWRRKGWDHLRR